MAAAVLLAPLERAANSPQNQFGCWDRAMLGLRSAGPEGGHCDFSAVRRAGEQAYRMAGVTPREIEFAELHDCFTIAEIVATEDLGSWKRDRAGRTRLQGARAAGRAAGEHQRRLKSKGHPVGATGVAQICDLVLQIRGEAGERQIERHSLALAENLGGSGPLAWSPSWGRHEKRDRVHRDRDLVCAGGVRADVPYQTAMWRWTEAAV